MDCALPTPVSIMATPVLVNALGDTLTNDRVASGFGSRLQNRPLWAFDWYDGGRLPDRVDHRFYALTAPDGFMVRRPVDIRDTIDPLPSSAFLFGMGGDSETIWVCAVVDNRIWKLDPRDWSILASRSAPRLSAGTSPDAIGGDRTTAWFFNFWPRFAEPPISWNRHDQYMLYRLDGTTLEVRASSSFRYLQSVDGDSTVAWAIHRDVNPAVWETAELLRISPTLEIVDVAPAPLRNEGHRAVGIAGSRHRIYLLTYDSSTPSSGWLHLLSPDTYAIQGSFGPFESVYTPRDIGGS